jgi:hypothetical protein
MRIKDYLDILDRLPQTPHHQNKLECSYLDDGRLVNSNATTFNKLEFFQSSYKDRMGRVKYRWKVGEEPNIDYKVDDIYIKTTNDLIFTTLIDLTYKYNFKTWTVMTSNMKSCYIDFRSRSWAILDSKCDKFYYVEDEGIIEKIFYSSVNEYPNGIPIIWGDL